MKLREALELVQQSSSDDARIARYLLGCSATPLHLRTFVHAHLAKQNPQFKVEIEPTVYGDLLGALARFEPYGYTAAIVVCEWYDLDPRLGFRRLGGWAPSLFDEIIHSVQTCFSQLRQSLERITQTIPVVLVLPTLPVAPLGISVPAQISEFEAQLWMKAWEFASWSTTCAQIRMINPAELDRVSPVLERFDLREELAHGFPYGLSHASKLAELIAHLLSPAPPLKGLITDLDDTLWDGILGEIGASGIRFTLDTGAQMHGVYQQFLSSLAERGVLLAIASKNDAALAEEALQRADLLIRRQHFFPVEVHWRSKSESVAAILSAWNVGPDAVAFVDDSPLELAEVQAHFPAIHTHLFPKGDSALLPAFFTTLRDWFGRSTIGGEDRIRSHSLQSNVAIQQQLLDPASQETFLKEMEARLSFQISREGSDRRAFELINKTNQFNLNGRRISEAGWREFLRDNDNFLMTLEYRDKFGPLGKIAALLGRVTGPEAEISTWVMSCRAFSRRIEHATLRYLFERLNVERISFRFETTARNSVLRQFFTDMNIPESSSVLLRAEFEARCPQLSHALEELATRV